jgi:hypothetical protein
MATRMQQRRGTASQWTSANPILNAGEMGWESDTNKFKIGDGINHWADLDYFIDVNSTVNPAFGSSITFEGATDNAFETTLSITDPTADRTITFPDATGTVALTSDIAELSQDAIDTALTAGTGITKTYNDGANTLTIAVDTTIIQGRVTDVSDTEIGYLNGVTSAIQTQLDDKSTASKTETLTNKTLTTPTINGPTITDTGQTPTIHGIYLPAPHTIIFEGTTANDFETTLTAGDPTADRTITLPDATGTVALTSDITTAINNLVDGAPAALDTLNELAAAINDDASYASTITTALGTKIAKADITAKGVILVGTGSGTYAAQSVGTNGQVLTANSAQADGVEWTTVSSYSAPTLGSTSIASGATVTTVAGLTLTAPTLTGTVTASGDINLSAAGGPGSLIDEFNLILMGAL